jgi:hypothetical protein
MEYDHIHPGEIASDLVDGIVHFFDSCLGIPGNNSHLDAGDSK